MCDQGSFSGAARELRRAQSAISHAIKALESAFDVQLFERNTRKATLTAAGRSLLPDARAVISRIEEMKTRAVSIAEAGVPQVSIAVDSYFPRAHLIECLRSLQAELEKSAYAAWKSKDAKFWGTFLSDKFVGWGESIAALAAHASVRRLVSLNRLTGGADAGRALVNHHWPWMN